jgi:hypothetical protein
MIRRVYYLVLLRVTFVEASKESLCCNIVVEALGRDSDTISVDFQGLELNHSDNYFTNQVRAINRVAMYKNYQLKKKPLVSFRRKGNNVTNNVKVSRNAYIQLF